MSEFELCLFCDDKKKLEELEFVCRKCAVLMSGMCWNSVKDSVPKHEQLVLCYTPKGQCICFFIDTHEMNKQLRSKGYPEEQVDKNRIPYYFCSQEIMGQTLNGITHWMMLPEPPK